MIFDSYSLAKKPIIFNYTFEKYPFPQENIQQLFSWDGISLIQLILQLRCKYKVHIQKKKVLHSNAGILKIKKLICKFLIYFLNTVIILAIVLKKQQMYQLAANVSISNL